MQHDGYLPLFMCMMLGLKADDAKLMMHKKCKTKRKRFNFNKNLACKLQMKMPIGGTLLMKFINQLTYFAFYMP